MTNTVTSCNLPPKDTRVRDLKQGTLFRYIDGKEFYIRTSDGGITNLRTGMLFQNPSNGIVYVVNELQIKTEVDC